MKKVAYLSRNSVVSEIFHLLPTYCPTAQMAEFMLQNVVYRATVYRTGVLGLKESMVECATVCVKSEVILLDSVHVYKMREATRKHMCCLLVLVEN